MNELSRSTLSRSPSYSDQPAESNHSPTTVSEVPGSFPDGAPLEVVQADDSPLPDEPSPDISSNPSSLQLSDESVDQPSRPVRSTRRPKTYEPETGRWI